MTVDKAAQQGEELAWFKSSFSAGNGGECLEVAMDWSKPTHSNGEGGQRIEAASCSRAVHVRDSKDTTRPGLVLGAFAWTAFVGFATR